MSGQKAAPSTPGSGVGARGNVSSIADRTSLIANPAPHKTQAPIRAELIGSDRCKTQGVTAHGHAPVLGLCRLLIEAGHDPATPLEAWRGDVLALRIRTIGEGARLRIASHAVAFERLLECTGGSTVRLLECTGGSTVREKPSGIGGDGSRLHRHVGAEVTSQQIPNKAEVDDKRPPVTDENPGKNGSKTVGRSPDGRFASGNSGRPRGVRNRATVLLDAITHDDLKAIMTKIVEKAKAGDLAAAKLIFDRIAPAPRGRALEIDLPALDKRNDGDTLIAIYDAITRAVVSGTITPSEAVELIAIVDAHRVAIKELRPDRMNPPFTLGQNEADELISF